jgi:hypothetical protein
MCHLIKFNSSILDITLNLSSLILDYFENKYSIHEFINKLKDIIPCSDKFIHIFYELFTLLKSYIKDNINILRSNITGFISIKQQKIYSKTINVLTKFKNICSKNDFKSSLNSFLMLKGGGLDDEDQEYNNINNIVIKNDCNNVTTLEIYKLYKIIKDFSLEQLKDIVIDDIENNIIKILYVCKFLINFIFKIIFLLKSNTENTIYKLLDFTDTVLSLIITISVLSLEKIKEYILIFLTNIMPQNEFGSKLIYLLKIISVSQNCQ